MEKRCLFAAMRMRRRLDLERDLAAVRDASAQVR